MGPGPAETSPEEMSIAGSLEEAEVTRDETPAALRPALAGC